MQILTNCILIIMNKNQRKLRSHDCCQPGSLIMIQRVSVTCTFDSVFLTCFFLTYFLVHLWSLVFTGNNDKEEKRKKKKEP